MGEVLFITSPRIERYTLATFSVNKHLSSSHFCFQKKSQTPSIATVCSIEIISPGKRVLLEFKDLLHRAHIV